MNKSVSFMIPSEGADGVDNPVHFPQGDSVQQAVQLTEIRFYLVIVYAVCIAISFIKKRQDTMALFLSMQFAQSAFYVQFDFFLGNLCHVVPDDIGNSIFLSSYWCGVCCIAWYRAFLRLGVDPDEANQWIWRVIERSLQMLPGFLVPFARKRYLGGMLKKAEPHSKKRQAGTLPEYDWSVTCKPVDKECFQLDIHECAIQKLCRKFHAEGLLPSLCRTDYLVAHYLHAGFERTKTLGDGDEVCNNTFRFHGECTYPAMDVQGKAASADAG